MIRELEPIKRVLLHDWDPIGVASSPEAVDEYDAYAFQIFTSLHSGATTASLADYLDWVVSEHMGLPGDPSLNRGIAKKVLEVHQSHKS